MLFFLYGEDAFRSKEKLNELKDRFAEKNPSSGLFIFDFSEKTATDSSFLESFGSSGLFSAKKFVVALDFLRHTPAENQKAILEALKKKEDLAQDPDLTILFYEQEPPKKTTSFYKYLASKAKKQEFPLLDSRSVEKWAAEYVKSSAPGISFSSKSLPMLISYVGNNLYLLRSELEKLINFKSEGEISENDVELLVKSHTESTVFQTIESLLSHDKKTALRLFHEQLQKGEDPFYLLSMYVYQVRTLLKISAAVESGNTNPQLIAKEAGVHPFVVQKALPQIRRRSLADLKKIYKKLEEIDIDVKTGKDNIPSLLDRFVAGL